MLKTQNGEVVGSGRVERLTYSVEEAAEMLGIGKSLAYELARHDKLPGARRLGMGKRGRIVVVRKVFEDFLAGAQK